MTKDREGIEDAYEELPVGNTRAEILDLAQAFALEAGYIAPHQLAGWIEDAGGTRPFQRMVVAAMDRAVEVVQDGAEPMSHTGLGAHWSARYGKWGEGVEGGGYDNSHAEGEGPMLEVLE